MITLFWTSRFFFEENARFDNRASRSTWNTWTRSWCPWLVRNLQFEAFWQIDRVHVERDIVVLARRKTEASQPEGAHDRPPACSVLQALDDLEKTNGLTVCIDCCRRPERGL